MRRLPRLIATLVLATGCATVDNGAEKATEKTVRVTKNAREVKDCKFLGKLQEEDHLSGSQLSQAVAESRATVYMRNKANAMGANTLLLIPSATNIGGSSQLGEAYACPAEPAAPAASPEDPAKGSAPATVKN